MRHGPFLSLCILFSGCSFSSGCGSMKQQLVYPASLRTEVLVSGHIDTVELVESKEMSLTVDITYPMKLFDAGVISTLDVLAINITALATPNPSPFPLTSTAIAAASMKSALLLGLGLFAQQVSASHDACEARIKVSFPPGECPKLRLNGELQACPPPTVVRFSVDRRPFYIAYLTADKNNFARYGIRNDVLGDSWLPTPQLTAPDSEFASPSFNGRLKFLEDKMIATALTRADGSDRAFKRVMVAIRLALWLARLVAATKTVKATLCFIRF